VARLRRRPGRRSSPDSGGEQRAGNRVGRAAGLELSRRQLAKATKAGTGAAKNNVVAGFRRWPGRRSSPDCGGEQPGRACGRTKLGGARAGRGVRRVWSRAGGAAAEQNAKRVSGGG
jgi:hypothetical protein